MRNGSFDDLELKKSSQKKKKKDVMRSAEKDDKETRFQSLITLKIALTAFLINPSRF